jgi:hypothetical protein
MEDFKTWIVKIILPSLVAVSIKLAVQSKKGITWFTVVTSFVTGVGCAYLFAPAVLSYTPMAWQTLAVAVIAISGEKIGLWLVYRFNVETVMTGLFEKLLKK